MRVPSRVTLSAQAAEAPPVRLSSYKGATLEVGERSGLIIGPSGTEYAVTSSDPDTVAVEQITGFWVAVAKSEGTAEITASPGVPLVGNGLGRVHQGLADGQLRHSVGPAGLVNEADQHCYMFVGRPNTHNPYE